MKSAWFAKWVMRPLVEWKTGLLECLPPALRRQLSPPKEPCLLEVGEAGGRLYRLLEEGRKELGVIAGPDQPLDPAVQALLLSREDPLILKVPSAWVLRKKSSE